MIGNDAIQAAIVALLKANTALTDWLTDRSAGDEIRETQWQGTEFSYPAVRVSVNAQYPGETTSKCFLENGYFTFVVMSFSEHDSSQQCDQLAKLVDDALAGRRLSGTGWGSLSIQPSEALHAARTGERLWEASNDYLGRLYSTA
jgi:hypothetical protein